MNNNVEKSIQYELREKWREIPSTRMERNYSSELLKWSDEKLLAYWEKCKVETSSLEVRGWYQELYREKLSGRSVADIGPGIGIDGIYFAQQGANVTFVDIVKDNLELIKRICNLKNIKANYYYIDDFFAYNFLGKFDVFTFIGSMHNAPFEFSKKQIYALSKFLNDNGKILMLAYPKERFIESGAKDFQEFGKKTDGERTPWCEWYDDSKIKELFGNNFILNWSRNFGKDNIEFNWFDLTKSSEKEIIENKKTYFNESVDKKSNCITQRNISEVLIKINKNVNILIFGASNGGKLVYENIKRINNEGKYNIETNAFLDNNEEKWGSRLCGIEILKPDKKLIDKADYVIIASDWKIEIEKQLADIGVAKETILTAY